MAKIAVLAYDFGQKNIVSVEVNKKTFYEQVAQALYDAGNEVLCLDCVWGAKKSIPQSVKDKLIEFEPDACLMTNYGFWDLADIVDCPLWYMDIDSIDNVSMATIYRMRNNISRCGFIISEPEQIQQLKEKFNAKDEQIVLINLPYYELSEKNEEKGIDLLYFGTNYCSEGYAFFKNFAKNAITEQEVDEAKMVLQQYLEDPTLTSKELYNKNHFYSKNRIDIPNSKTYNQIVGVKNLKFLSGLSELNIDVRGAGWSGDSLNYFPEILLNSTNARNYDFENIHELFDTAKVIVYLDNGPLVAGSYLRIIDALSSDACLVAQKGSRYDDLFNTLGVPTFTTMSEAVAVCKNLIADDEKREKLVEDIHSIIKDKFSQDSLIDSINEKLGIVRQSIVSEPETTENGDENVEQNIIPSLNNLAKTNDENASSDSPSPVVDILPSVLKDVEKTLNATPLKRDNNTQELINQDAPTQSEALIDDSNNEPNEEASSRKHGLLFVDEKTLPVITKIPTPQKAAPKPAPKPQPKPAQKPAVAKKKDNWIVRITKSILLRFGYDIDNKYPKKCFKIGPIIIFENMKIDASTNHIFIFSLPVLSLKRKNNELRVHLLIIEKLIKLLTRPFVKLGNAIKRKRKVRIERKKKRAELESKIKLYRELNKKLAGGKKIKVCLFVSRISCWTFANLYKILQNSGKFEPIIVVKPFMFQGKEAMIDYMKITYNELKSQGYNVIRAYDEETDKFLDLREELNPDIVFYTKYWKPQFHDNFYITKFKDKLTFYTSYCYDVAYHPEVMNFELNNTVNRYFMPTEIHKSMAQRVMTNHAKNVHVVGAPKLDVFFDASYVPQEKWKNVGDGKARKRIIWAPHHSDNFPQNLYQFNAFYDLADYMFELAQKYEDEIQIAFKPHPMLKPYLYKKWGVESTDSYYQKWADLPTGQLETGEFEDLFLTSDAMILDSISFIAEYTATNKPALFTIGSQSRVKLNDFGSIIFDVLYHTDNNLKDDIDDFVKNVVINGLDTKKESREAFVSQYMLPPNGKSSAENIYDNIMDEIVNGESKLKNEQL